MLVAQAHTEHPLVDCSVHIFGPDLQYCTEVAKIFSL